MNDTQLESLLAESLDRANAAAPAVRTTDAGLAFLAQRSLRRRRALAVGSVATLSLGAVALLPAAFGGDPGSPARFAPASSASAAPQPGVTVGGPHQGPSTGQVGAQLELSTVRPDQSPNADVYPVSHSVELRAGWQLGRSEVDPVGPDSVAVELTKGAEVWFECLYTVQHGQQIGGMVARGGDLKWPEFSADCREHGAAHRTALATSDGSRG